MILEKKERISFKLEVFEGPLDLLYHLIKAAKIDIRDIFISEITEQYLEIVRNNNYLKDKEVFASINNKQELVKVIDVNEDNSLKILLDEEIINIFSGEITFHKD